MFHGKTTPTSTIFQRVTACRSLEDSLGQRINSKQMEWFEKIIGNRQLRHTIGTNRIGKRCQAGYNKRAAYSLWPTFYDHTSSPLRVYRSLDQSPFFMQVRYRIFESRNIDTARIRLPGSWKPIGSYRSSNLEPALWELFFDKTESNENTGF